MDKNDPLRQLLLAAVLLTRLPLPHLKAETFEQGPRAVWAYPLVGVIVGGAGALAGHLALGSGMPEMVAAALALGLMMLVTGAMHEDGLADMFDGFWGGFTPARRLEIMRDSQIGTYGVLALVMTSLVKVSALAVLLESSVLALVAAAALSRSVMPVVMHVLPAARADGLSQSVGRPPLTATLLAVGVGAGAALLCLGMIGLAALLTAAICASGVATVAKRKIGGQTGDVLGATQSLSEAAILLICVVLL